jgi:hypothetical protein
MDLVIAHNPNSENPEDLYDALKMASGESYIDNLEPDRDAIKNLQGLISPQMEK